MRGVYTLYLSLPAETTITVGALSERRFEAGVYCYVGSAQNGVERRLQRHLTGSGKTHWHIDYLRAHTEPVGWQVLQGNSALECVLARFLAQHHERVDGFGCSDCDCRAHLFRLDALSPEERYVEEGV